MNQHSTIIVIPARLNSTRLARKMLLAETGKPLLQHTVETAQRSRLAQRVIVGTEDREIVDAVKSFGGDVVMTAQHVTGTDRVAEVARLLPSATIVVNLQGDEPEISPQAIDAAIQSLVEHPTAAMSTLATPIREPNRLDDPSCVKVVVGAKGQALWFSRCPIPYVRDRSRDWMNHEPPVFFQHLGLYAYRAEFLQQVPHLPPSVYEQVESLEQLRVLTAGHTIQVAVIDMAHKGIDTLDDYRAFVARRRDRLPTP